MLSRVVCVRCPRSCLISVLVESGSVKSVEGYGCLLGVEYAREEVENPKRVVCSTVRVVGGRYPRLPVRTAEPVPKSKLKEVVEALRGVTVRAPVRRGEVVVRNVAGTGVDVVAEMDAEAETG
jgi:CxxC motif-containing protein